MSDRQQNAALTIPLDDDSLVRLMDLSRACGLPIADLAASLLHDLLEEDETAHLSTSPAGSVRLN